MSNEAEFDTYSKKMQAALKASIARCFGTSTAFALWFGRRSAW